MYTIIICGMNIAKIRSSIRCILGRANRLKGFYFNCIYMSNSTGKKLSLEM